ncbi:MAG: hypothetical protein JXA20_08880 [Spirochaetes bacterium]|nr:hypothetical protein [Spirochaetota bacterium]
MEREYQVDVLDVFGMPYHEMVAAVALQGLVNRDGPSLFLDWGIYDDPNARKTNEVFLPEEIWRSTYRDAIGDQDLKNLEYYRSRYPMKITSIPALEIAVKKYRALLAGSVVWDPEMPDTVNVALMLASLEGLLPVHPEAVELAEGRCGLSVVEDLRGRWVDRVALHRWSFQHLFPRCAPGRIASIEPGWGRPEFLDYAVRQRIFLYSLATKREGPLFKIGQTLLLLLVAGPRALREFLFTLRLDAPVRRAGLAIMHLASPETRLASAIQRAVKPEPFPTVFGWHTRRDDELSFMIHLSANGLRLVPSHLAGNFSFHCGIPAGGELRQRHVDPEGVTLENKIYLTFTLSDGDQLVLMNTGELGNWDRPERGSVPFNWETQPLLAEIAPALLDRYYTGASAADLLVAGPSGAGYIVPPLMPRLREYLRVTAGVCRRADIRVITSYIGDPTRRIVREHCRMPGDVIGFTSGYVHFGSVPLFREGGRTFAANAVPAVEKIADSAADTLEAVRRLIEAPGPVPRFIGVHLFAYRTTLADVQRFAATLDPARVKVVRADEFLVAAGRHMERLDKNEMMLQTDTKQ